MATLAAYLATRAQRRLALRRRHGRSLDGIPRSAGDAPRNQGGMFHCRPHDAGVDQREFHSKRPGNDIGRRTPRKKIQQHLPGYFPGVGGDARRGDAVVAGEYRELAPTGRGHKRLLDAGDLRRQGFQPAEGADRLGLGVDGLPDGAIEVGHRYRRILFGHYRLRRPSPQGERSAT